MRTRARSGLPVRIFIAVGPSIMLNSDLRVKVKFDITKFITTYARILIWVKLVVPRTD